MYCKNCGKEIGNDDKFCANCGCDSIKLLHDLDGVTKISTPLFLLFYFITLGIYCIVKWYRMTGDLRKIVAREETVSPLIITAGIFLGFAIRIVEFGTYSGDDTIVGVSLILYFPLLFCGICLYCHMIYRTLNNIRKIARIKQNKDLKYNKFWAFIFNIIYINFVINTYDQRLVENRK